MNLDFQNTALSITFWQNKCIRFFQFQFKLLKPTQHDLNTNPIDKTTALSVKKTPPPSIPTLC